MLKVIASFALNDIIFRAEWQDGQGRTVWRNVSFSGIDTSNTLYFRVRGASESAPTKSFGRVLPSLPRALQNWELRVPMTGHRDELIAAVTWRIGASEKDYKIHFYTVREGTILSEVEQPEGGAERPVPGFIRALEE